MTEAHNKWMEEALKLARLGGRQVAPNPMVGAVIVQNGKIIGEGYHKKFGGPHAEVNAIRSVKRKADLAGATLYVTLEPCRHQGKTPPCQNLIDSMGIAEIICGSRDPFQKGKRSKKLQFVTVKMADACRELNKFYFTWITKKRPYITVKIATSADGFVAGPKGESIHFTSATQDRRVHELRAGHQAILVGSNTVLADDPHLGVRHVRGKDPLRVILDSQKRIPKNAKVFRDKNYLHVTKRMPIRKLMRELARRGISSLLVEPGPTLYALLKRAKLIDELVVLKGKKKIKVGLAIKI